MKIILVHNAEAGYEQPSRIRIMESLKKHNADIKYISSKSKNFESLVLSELGDRVIVAGGDGTVHKVARMLIDQPIPLAIMPIGTANNVAMSLSTERVSLNSTYWMEGEVVQVDVGEADINGQKRIFFESLGFGTLASMMRQYEIVKKHKKPHFENRKEKLRYLDNFMLKILPGLVPNDYRITVDQENYDGKYLWVEVINMKYFGPHLSLAPEADFRDGALEMVLIREDEKPLLEQYFAARLAGEEVEPNFRVVKGESFSMTTGEEPLHMDDAILTKGEDAQSAAQFQLLIRAKQRALSLVKYPFELTEDSPQTSSPG